MVQMMFCLPPRKQATSRNRPFRSMAPVDIVMSRIISCGCVTLKIPQQNAFSDNRGMRVTLASFPGRGVRASGRRTCNCKSRIRVCCSFVTFLKDPFEALFGTRGEADDATVESLEEVEFFYLRTNHIFHVDSGKASIASEP